VLPEYKTPAWFQQLPHLPHHHSHIPHSTQHLNAQHRVQAPLFNSLVLQDIAVFNAACQELVLVLQMELLELGGDVGCVHRARLHAVDEVHGGQVVAVQLVARAWAELEDGAVCSADERGDYRCVLEGDEAVGCAQC
jgi:hypothetical protein